MKLNKEQLEEFDQQGYLFMPNCFSKDEAALLKQAATDVYAMEREEVWRETSGVARTAFAAHTYNDTFRRLGAHPRLIDPVMQLVDGPVYMHQYKVNAKAAFVHHLAIGRGKPRERDLQHLRSGSIGLHGPNIDGLPGLHP